MSRPINFFDKKKFFNKKSPALELKPNHSVMIICYLLSRHALYNFESLGHEVALPKIALTGILTITKVLNLLTTTSIPQKKVIF